MRRLETAHPHSLRCLLASGILFLCGCDVVLRDLHLSNPDPPENLRAVFTEDIFGTDGVRLTWDDPNGTHDLVYFVYRDGDRRIADIEPDCRYEEEELICNPVYYHFYFDENVARGETHCYTVSCEYIDDLFTGESDRSPEVCITIPMEGFTEGPALAAPSRKSD